MWSLFKSMILLERVKHKWECVEEILHSKPAAQNAPVCDAVSYLQLFRHFFLNILPFRSEISEHQT